MNQRQYCASVKELLRNLENVFKNQSGAGSYNKETMIQKTDEVIFREGKDWSDKTKSLSALEELELIDEVGVYLEEQKHEYVRYRVFETLFSTARENCLEYRREILSRLISIAVVAKLSAVLECAALWIKSSEKEHALHVVSELVNDYCVLKKGGNNDLKNCLNICPRFCCVFMAALTSKYNLMSKQRSGEIQVLNEIWPCYQLLDVVQYWLMNDSTLCFCTTSQMDKLWRTVIKATQSMPDNLPLTPLDGLAEWCVKLPFSPSEILSEKFQNDIPDEPKDNVPTYSQLHSMFHYAFLKSLLASKPALKAIAKGSVLGNPDLQLWNKNQVHTLVGDLLSICDAVSPPIKGTSTELSVDRFAQISQVAMSMRVLNCSKDQFQSLSDPLPKTRLLELVAYGSERRSSIDGAPMEISSVY